MLEPVSIRLFSAALLMATESSNPAAPVRVLAHHELAMTPRMPRPWCSRMMSLLTEMDAAGNSFLVKTAAAEHEWCGDATMTRSAWEWLAGLIPA